MATHSPAHTPGHGHDHAHDHQPGGHHIIEPAVYYKVFGGLMVLLVITLVAAYFDLGSLNLAIAMSIAIAKVVLIVLFFMHLRYSTKLVQFFAGAALMWLIIMFALILGDYLARQSFQTLLN